MSGGLIKSLFPLLLHFTINYSRTLSTPLNSSMHSVNMKHILKWSPLQANCSTVNYSVQFQGCISFWLRSCIYNARVLHSVKMILHSPSQAFLQNLSLKNLKLSSGNKAEYELYKLNGTWVNAYDCQEISKTRCDLTHDLASNCDYSIRIKTNCDGKKTWTHLPATFNRRDTVLLAPKMTVNVEGDPIQVGFSTTLSDMTVNLKVWKEGDEQNALINVIRSYPYHLSIAAHRGQEKMCFRAEAVVEAINKNFSIDTQCIIIPEQTSDFVKPMIVSISVIVSVAMAFILGWSATHFGPQIKQICHREPIPSVLIDDWPTNTPILCTDVSLEPTDPLLLETVQANGTV